MTARDDQPTVCAHLVLDAHHAKGFALAAAGEFDQLACRKNMDPII
jgi:hypothetical protein